MNCFLNNADKRVTTRSHLTFISELLSNANEHANICVQSSLGLKQVEFELFVPEPSQFVITDSNTVAVT